MRDYRNDIWIEFYKDEADQWRWRIWANNGNILADSGQGYESSMDCFNGLNTIHNALVVGFNSHEPVRVEGLAIHWPLGTELVTPED